MRDPERRGESPGASPPEDMRAQLPVPTIMVSGLVHRDECRDSDPR